MIVDPSRPTQMNDEFYSSMLVAYNRSTLWPFRKKVFEAHRSYIDDNSLSTGFRFISALQIAIDPYNEWGFVFLFIPSRFSHGAPVASNAAAACCAKTSTSCATGRSAGST